MKKGEREEREREKDCTIVQ